MFDRKLITEYIEKIFHLFWKENIDNSFLILNHVICFLYLRYIEDYGIETEGVENSLFIESDSTKGWNWKYAKTLKEDDFIENYNNNIIPFLDTQIVYCYKVSFFINKIEKVKKTRLVYELFLLMEEMFLALEDDNKIPSLPYEIIYEELLKRYHQANVKDDLIVPSHIARLMVELSQPVSSDTIYTPILSTGDLLVSAYQKILCDILPEQRIGFDVDGFPYNNALQEDWDKKSLGNIVLDGNELSDENMFLCIMNFYFHRITLVQNFIKQDPLTKDFIFSLYTKIMVAPLVPNSAKEIKNVDEKLQELIGKNRPAMYLQRCFEQLKTSGRLVALMPDSFLSAQDRRITNFRSRILEEYDLEAVISLPKGVFASYSNIKTSIIVFSKQKPSYDDVWMCELKNDGYTLNSKRQRNGENPLPKLVANFKQRAVVNDGLMETFLVPKVVVKKHRSAWTVKFFNDYDIPVKTLDDPIRLLSRLKEIEGKIHSELLDLSLMLGDGEILG